MPSNTVSVSVEAHVSTTSKGASASLLIAGLAASTALAGESASSESLLLDSPDSSSDADSESSTAMGCCAAGC